MKPRRLAAPLFFAIAVSLAQSAIPSDGETEAYRTFTNAQGRTIEARVLQLSGDTVSIAMRDGREFSIPVSGLSAEDRNYLASWKPRESVPSSGADPTALNGLIGHELFAGPTLWSSEPASVAERLSWPRESETPFTESFRFYPPEDYRFLGARPHSAALYGSEDGISRISIVFANKGDSFGAAGSGEDHFIEGKKVPGGLEGLEILMEHDAKMIRGKLSSELGEPSRQKFGDGESRVDVERWDWNGHSFLLSNVEGEYVSLAIETPAFADDRGRSSRVPDAVIRERARGFVERRENGDVVISNIPMVDQGPKGYCVPATAERCMRFLGIPADMYLLAMAGQTQAGGGTSVEVLLSHIGRDIKRKGRSFEIESGELELRDIKRSIDDGIPIMWAMQSTPEFNDVANDRTESRQEEDWSAYKERVAAEAESTPIAPRPGYNHVVIIMGYNEETEEIAFSDSWGPRYKERWITVAEAQKISSDRYYIIDL